MYISILAVILLGFVCVLLVIALVSLLDTLKQFREICYDILDSQKEVVKFLEDSGLENLEILKEMAADISELQSK